MNPHVGTCLRMILWLVPCINLVHQLKINPMPSANHGPHSNLILFAGHRSNQFFFVSGSCLFYHFFPTTMQSPSILRPSHCLKVTGETEIEAAGAATTTTSRSPSGWPTSFVMVRLRWGTGRIPEHIHMRAREDFVSSSGCRRFRCAPCESEQRCCILLDYCTLLCQSIFNSKGR